MEKLERAKLLGLSFLIIVIFVITLIAIITILDINIDYLNINPSENTIQKKMILTYPHSGPSIGTYTDAGANNKAINCAWLSMEVVTEYKGVLSEQSIIDVRAQGYVYPTGVNEIRPMGEPDQNGAMPTTPQILFGFEGASKVTPIDESSGLIGGQFFVPLVLVPRDDILTTKSGHEDEIPALGSIMWDYQGDYYPYIQFFNKTTATLETIYYPEYRIHVAASDIVLQKKYTRINTYLTIFLFFFTLITSLQLIYNLIPDRLLIKYGLKSSKGSEVNSSTDTNVVIPNTDQIIEKLSDTIPVDSSEKTQKEEVAKLIEIAKK